MATVFTAWNYDLSFLELFAFLTSLMGVGLAVMGPRKTWHWWNISSALYGILFLQEKYFASAALQIIFIVGGIWGWFGWGAKGATPAKLSPKERVQWCGIFLLSWAVLYPVLKKIGAAASLTDAFGFVGSAIAQLWMVLEKYEAWPLWFVVDAVYTYQFFHGGQYLTALLYLIFVGLAVAGWRTWLKKADASPAIGAQ
ncbi:MAG: nicotinamide mononucleotide transporter [Actinobacteria bacterium]|nr:nicotinamide mononucleotide transporter [Actinomycetota bacterium]MSX48887.1 nicotinamide mononucleotide transporter [Actinomycetota bacterium]MSY09385.1 nicotinamide mononucleotide transporter [Actinomycetota bacterium]